MTCKQPRRRAAFTAPADGQYQIAIGDGTAGAGRFASADAHTAAARFSASVAAETFTLTPATAGDLADDYQAAAALRKKLNSPRSWLPAGIMARRLTIWPG